jgi:hypothetical protein
MFGGANATASGLGREAAWGMKVTGVAVSKKTLGSRVLRFYLLENLEW